MASQTISTEYERKMLIRRIEQHKLPFTADIATGKHRTTEQNKLQRKWVQEISDQTGMKPEEVRGFCKLTIGVPLLRAENDEFRAKYDEHVRPLTYEQKLAIMSEPLDMPVTRLMNVDQKTRYLNNLFDHFTGKGIVLTVPEDRRFGSAAA